MTKQSNNKDTVKIGVDDFLGDIFDLNIKGLKSLWTLLSSPSKYFESAHSPNWDNHYTPSIRLWFSALAVLFFFKFIWGSDDAAMLQVLEARLQLSNIQLPDHVSYELVAQTYARWWFAYIPLVTALMVLTLGILWPFWGGLKSLSLKARYIYATACPSAFFLIIATLAQSYAPNEWFFISYFTSAFIVFCLDSTTAYRGAFVENNLRLIRSISLAFALFWVGLGANILAQILATQTISYLYG